VPFEKRKALNQGIVLQSGDNKCKDEFITFLLYLTVFPSKNKLSGKWNNFSGHFFHSPLLWGEILETSSDFRQRRENYELSTGVRSHCSGVISGPAVSQSLSNVIPFAYGRQHAMIPKVIDIELQATESEIFWETLIWSITIKAFYLLGNIRGCFLRLEKSLFIVLRNFSFRCDFLFGHEAWVIPQKSSFLLNNTKPLKRTTKRRISSSLN